ncbi:MULTISPECIES: peptidyl-prolyl cis-trans isomerase [unclassified Roseovarius]|uniref:peptidyl-prolyl cis-trans isomerase n=1 Tax=unclassified Roseovarius TaxID=2614913 RepID=UPI00273FCDB8|nr:MULTISPECIES: peptidyl-prolyl cis-trans isomerase [unclassified Roseovarius]
MAGKGISKSLVWILMGLLILGLGGFGVTNLSGSVRSVGSVGETEIGLNDYARTLQNQIRALETQVGGPVSFAQAQEAGLDAAVLSQLVAITALEEETRRLGISMGDGNLRQRITEIEAFQRADGTFDREAYSFALEQAGSNEAEFEDGLRSQEASSILQNAVLGGVNAPDAYTDTLLNFLAEERDITWAVLTRDDLATGLPVPTDDDLRAYHEENAAAFTTPETKRLTYAWMTPDMIIDTVEVDEDTLRAAYDDRAAEYIQPERRLVERLAFADDASATAALERINSGEATFEALVEERGLALADIDLGDVQKIELEAAGDAVFAAEAGDIVGPLESPIGPALFRVNAILAARETTFEQALPELRDEIAGDRARRVVDGQIEGVDDLLAGGATIEDLAEETEMVLGQIDWHVGVTDGIAAYDAFRQAAGAITAEDYPDVAQLEDGGIFAMRLDEVVPPTLQPLEQVRTEVEDAWRREEVEKALNSQVQAQAAQLTEGTSFEDLGMEAQSAQGLSRRGFQEDVPPEFVEVVYGMAKGDVELIQGGGRLFVLRLDDVRKPDATDPDLATLRQSIQEQTAGSIAQDLYQILANDIRTRAGIEINQQALNAVHSNFQ